MLTPDPRPVIGPGAAGGPLSVAVAVIIVDFFSKTLGALGRCSAGTHRGDRPADPIRARRGRQGQLSAGCRPVDPRHETHYTGTIAIAIAASILPTGPSLRPGGLPSFALAIGATSGALFPTTPFDRPALSASSAPMHTGYPHSIAQVTTQPVVTRPSRLHIVHFHSMSASLQKCPSVPTKPQGSISPTACSPTRRTLVDETGRPTESSPPYPTELVPAPRIPRASVPSVLLVLREPDGWMSGTDTALCTLDDGNPITPALQTKYGLRRSPRPLSRFQRLQTCHHRIHPANMDKLKPCASSTSRINR
ncbi:hypothetical protein CMUS01_11938 [Colletotrichum musicola]|uniref:Uncharacterized protein n=1 Tax=Colletotrichum musicola TaxID=2175873 RepID=A0A8H6N2Y3_9PEZI|nr:hypothetical protein CMUS01_11938 [Colletotrichum musicola]